MMYHLDVVCVTIETGGGTSTVSSHLAVTVEKGSCENVKTVQRTSNEMITLNEPRQTWGLTGFTFCLNSLIKFPR